MVECPEPTYEEFKEYAKKKSVQVLKMVKWQENRINELEAALANQRRRMGAEFDEVSLELQDVRKKARANIEKLEKDVNYWKEYKGEDCEGCSDRDAQLDAYAASHGADEERIKELEEALALTESLLRKEREKNAALMSLDQPPKSRGMEE